MSNLSIESLNRIVETGDMDRFMSAGKTVRPHADLSGSTQAGALGEIRDKEDLLPTTFSEVLKKSVDQVNEYQIQADSAIKELVAGRSKNIHETLLAVERADASLRLMMQVRNKVLDAYREIIRMQV